MPVKKHSLLASPLFLLIQVLILSLFTLSCRPTDSGPTTWPHSIFKNSKAHPPGSAPGTSSPNHIDQINHIDLRQFYYPRWSSAFDVQILNDHFINTGRYISGPWGTWQKLLRIHYLSPDNFEQQSTCLFFRLPSHHNVRTLMDREQGKKTVTLGELRAVDVPFNEKCELHQAQQSPHSIKNILGLMVLLTDHQEKSLQGVGPLRPYHLYLMMEAQPQGPQKPPGRKAELRQMSFPLANIKMGRLKLNPADKRLAPSRIHERYASSVQQRLLPGVTFFSLKIEGQPILSGHRPKQLGQPQDNYKEGNLVKCHEVNEECETIQEFTCDRCRYGWFETVGSGCLRGGTKYCGINRCGTPGNPACPRGETLSQLKGMQQCQDGSLSGFCQGDAETFCDENQVLQCL